MRTRYYHRLLTLAAMSTSVLLSQCSSSPPSGSEPVGRQRQAVVCDVNGLCDDSNPCTYGDRCDDLFTNCHGTPLPPQDACWNNAVDPGVPTSLYDATTFLWEPGGIQGPIFSPVPFNRPERVGVVRGQVKDRAGTPLAGVTISIRGHNEYGSTQTLGTEGWFDMVVNGGGDLVVRYEKAGYLPVERKVRAPWKDYVIAGDVAMTPVPSQIGTFTCGSGPQAFHTNAVDGRQITVFFPEGTCVDGYSGSPTFSVRAVEYTTGGTDGKGDPASMPSELPPASQFTFAAEFQLYEGSTLLSPTFTGQVITYVDDFLGIGSFPNGLGAQVPSGYYDKDLSAWVQNTDGPQALNGSVVTVGSLSPDERTALLGAGYTDMNAKLWRVPLKHFSSVDYNWPGKPPEDAIGPDGPAPAGDKSQDQPSCTTGSIIACENQVLGERLPLAGTPFDLVYRSDRVPGYKAARQLVIPLVGSTTPPDLESIELKVVVAGRQFEPVLPQGAQSYTFEWDGLDSYNRKLNGAQPVTVKLGYVYDADYSGGQGFGNPGDSTVVFNATRQKITYWREWKGTIGGWDATGFGLGGWSLDQLHAYSRDTQQLYRGDGSRRTAAAMAETIQRLMGGTATTDADGLPSEQTKLNLPGGIAFGPDGSLYITERGSTPNKRIRKIAPDGIVSTVYSGTLVPRDVAVLADGRLVFVETTTFRLWRLETNGTTTELEIPPPYSLGSDANGGPFGVAVGSDGSIFVADGTHRRVLKRAPDGTVTVFAGTGSYGDTGDELGLATAATFKKPWGLAVMADGSVLIADHAACRVRRVDPAGYIHAFAGDSCTAPEPPDGVGDGLLATAADLEGPHRVTVAPNGSVYIADYNDQRIRRVDAAGRISTIAGNGQDTAGCPGDGGQATAAIVRDPEGLAIHPDGTLYYADENCALGAIRRIAPPDFGTVIDTENDMVGVPSEDGSELYVFWGYNGGRHIATLDTATGQLRYSFDYGTFTVQGNTVQLPTAVHDLRGATNTTGRTMLINRDPTTGNLTGFTSAGGQTSSVTPLTGAFLETLTRPGVSDEDPSVYTMGYVQGGGGLLQNYADPRGKAHAFEYEASGNGKLYRDRDPYTLLTSTPFKQLERDSLASGNGYEVQLSRYSGLATTYLVETATTGDKTWKMTGPDGLQVQTTTEPDESSHTTYPVGAAYPTKVDVTTKPDPRFGTSVMVSSSTLTLPSGKVLIVDRTREADPPDLNFTTLTETVKVKSSLSDPGVDYVTTIDRGASTPTVVATTPVGRSVRAELDSYGRPTTIGLNQTTPAVDDVDLDYNNGRLWHVRQGDRVLTINWGPNGFPSTMWAGTTANPVMHWVATTFDDRGELRSFRRTDGKYINLKFDASSNLIKLERPNGANSTIAHEFKATDVDLLERYDGPDITTAQPNDGVTTYEWDIDRRLKQVNWTDSSVIKLEYFGQGVAGAGKLHYLKDRYNAPLSTYAYDAANGNLQTIATTSPSVTTTFGWDGPAPTSMQTTFPNAMSKTAGWSLGAYLRVTGETATGGNAANYVYDDDGLIIDTYAQVGFTTYHLTTPRNPQTGWVDSTNLVRVSQAMVYDPTYGQLTTVTTNFSYPSTTHVHSLSLSSYDELGRILQKREKVLADLVWTTRNYHYDTAGRLDGDGSTTWAYDDNGNRTTLNTNTSAGVYDAQDRIQRWNGTTYTHDTNGNRKTKTASGSTTTYNYDAFQNLKSVTLPGGAGAVTYDIDGLGRRIGRHRTGTSTSDRYYLLGKGNRVLAEYDGSGTILSRFIYSTRSHVPDYMIKNGIVYRFITDQLGSVRLVVNVNAASATLSVVKRIYYDAWGNITSESGTLDQPFGFAGGLHDRDTGLVHFGAREYDPYTGRWLQKDPIRFAAGDTNLYAYAGNDPVNRIDPSGLRTWSQAEVGALLREYAYEIDMSEDPWENMADNSFGGKYDWYWRTPDGDHFPNREDLFDVPGFGLMNSGQFGNFMAGFAGGYHDCSATGMSHAIFRAAGAISGAMGHGPGDSSWLDYGGDNAESVIAIEFGAKVGAEMSPAPWSYFPTGF